MSTPETLASGPPSRAEFDTLAGTVDALTTRVTALEGRVAALEPKVAALEVRVVAHDAQLVHLEDKLAAKQAEESVDALKARVEALEEFSVANSERATRLIKLFLAPAQDPEVSREEYYDELQRLAEEHAAALEDPSGLNDRIPIIVSFALGVSVGLFAGIWLCSRLVL